MKAFLSCLVTLATLSTLTACPYRVRRAVVVEKVVEVVTPIVAVPVVQVYGAAFVPPAPVQAVAPATPAVAAPAAVSPCEKELAALRAEMTALRQEIRGGKPVMPRADAPPAAAAPNALRGEAVFKRACAACHSDTAPLKGFEAASKLHLFTAGKFVPPDAKTQLKIFKRVGRSPDSAGVMPPKESGIAPLSEQEAVDLGEYLDALKE